MQRRFTKRIPGLQSHSYYIRLTLLGIESLEARRLKADLLYVYKILFKYVDVDSESFFSVIGTDDMAQEAMIWNCIQIIAVLM